MSKPIYINGRFLSQIKSGTQRFAREIIIGIDDIIYNEDLDTDVYLLIEKNITADLALKRIKVRPIGKSTGHLWEQVDLFYFSRTGVLLNLINSGSLLHENQIVTFHDASIYDTPETFGKKYLLFHRIMRPLLAQRAKYMMTVSNFSKERLERFLPISKKKTTVVYNGCDHISRLKTDADVLIDYGLTSQQYFLFVGNQAPNKNYDAAVKAFREARLPRMKLVIVGASNKNVFGSLTVEGDDVVAPRNVSDEHLATLYCHANAFLFPSLYEGFGIPPLEAMRLGCPVIANRAAAIPEIVGDAALLINASDTAEFAGALNAVCQDPTLRAEMIRKGLARSLQFTWHNSARTCLDLLLRASTTLKSTTS